MRLDDHYKIFPDDVRGELFIRIKGSYFKDGTWKNWPKSTKAIVPVIMKHSNTNGYSFPGQTRIAIYSGLTEKSVREGLSRLKNFQDFGIKKEFSPRGRIKNNYWFQPVSKNEKGAVFISHAFFNGGNWARLSPSAKAIYPVLKYFCYWDYDLYEEMGESSSNFDEVYKDRKYDFLSTGPEAIAELSGVSKGSLPSAFRSLEKHYFMEHIGMVDGRKTWKLFTQPTNTFAEEMNEQTRKRYNLNKNSTYQVLIEREKITH